MTDETTTSPTNGNPPPQDPGIDLNQLQIELENSKNKLAELTQISQQALADLQNFKKRTEEEKARFVTFANSALITDLLPILDNIQRANSHLPTDPAAREWANGIIAIGSNMEEILKSRGLETINTTNLTFDPNLHEAIATENGPQDHIIRELEKGYKIGERILRRAKVSVGQTAPTPSTENN